MEHEHNHQPTPTYSKSFRLTLHNLFDVLAVFSAVGIVLTLMRLNQFGISYLFGAALLAALSVLPSIVLRADRFLAARGALLTTGVLIAVGVGLVNLGLATAGLLVIPFFLALSATMLSRAMAFVFFGTTIAALVVAAYLFNSERLMAPELTLADWNQSPTNWIILIVTISMTSLLTITLVHSLSTFWKETDRQALNRYAQFEALVEFAPEAIVILDMDTGQFVTANSRAEELFGLSRENLVLGPGVGDLSPKLQPSGESSGALAGKHIEDALAGRHPTFEWTHMNSDGVEIPCEISLSRIPPFDRKLVRGSIVDITDRLASQKQRDQLQVQLAASQKLEAIGKLTGGVAHDFNNLLAVILGNLELLQEELDTDVHREFIQPCVEATLRGASLTRSMLSFARRAPLDPQIVDLNKMVLETKNWTSRTLPKNISVETSLLAGLWQVAADPGATESALLNLILNARDAMPVGGKLTIETSNVRIDQTYVDNRNEELTPGRYVMVAVSDTGEGIEKENLEVIFDPFFTTKAAGKGSGLGLSMVLGFMRQSGGTAQLYTEVGVGTTFKLYFPAISNTQEISDREQKTGSNSTGSGERILIAEDEEEVLAVLVATLNAAGYEVTAVSTGDEAAGIFKADPNFDLLLTDIVMPGTLQGPSLSKALREIDDALPVIFMSGYAAEATVHGNGLRPDDIRLMKPVLRRDLLTAIRHSLGSSLAAPGSRGDETKS